MQKFQQQYNVTIRKCYNTQRMKLKDDIISRIRWKSVMVVLLVIVIIAIAFSSVNLFSSGYMGKKDIKIRTWLDPSTVDLNGKSIVWSEVKNTGQEDVWILLNLDTDDPALLFKDTENQSTSEFIKLGPGESRKLDFKIELVYASYSGDYGINILLKYDEEEIKDKIYLKVMETD